MAKTGRIFECLSLKGPESTLMADYFTIGKSYYECDLDITGQNLNDETSVLLYTNPVTTDGYSIACYVDLMDFELIAIQQTIHLN